MSQAKVDQYKKDKANRQKIMKKEKRVAFLEKTILVLIGVAVIGWIGFSVYRYGMPGTSDETTQTAETTDVNMSAISDFYQSVNE